MITPVTNPFQGVGIESPKKILVKATSVALPVIAFLAMNSLPAADGGPITWAGCIAACEAVAASATVATGGAAAGSLIACVNACAPLIALPFCP